jgi:hypothetical protein
MLKLTEFRPKTATAGLCCTIVMTAVIMGFPVQG